MVESTPVATRPARGGDGDASTSTTPLPSSAMRTPQLGTKRLSFSATTPMGSVGRTRTPGGSGVKVTGFGELCAVCYSPLDRAEAAAEDGDPIDDVKRELFTTECNHTYHRCCLVRCREADFTLCCLCKTGRIDGHGLTPEHVREKRAAQAVLDAQNAQRNAVIGAAARAREAVRRQYVRAMVNRPAQSRSQIVMPPVTEEGSPGAGAVSDGAPGGQPPGSPARSIAASCRSGSWRLRPCQQRRQGRASTSSCEQP